MFSFAFFLTWPELWEKSSSKIAFYLPLETLTSSSGKGLKAVSPSLALFPVNDDPGPSKHATWRLSVASCPWELSQKRIKTSAVLFHCYVKTVNFTPNLKSVSLPHFSPWSVCACWTALDRVFPDERLWAESPVCVLSPRGRSMAPSITRKSHIQWSGVAVCQCLHAWALLAHSRHGCLHWSDILPLWRENKEERVVFPWELIKEMFTSRHVGESFWLIHELTWTWC